jgi:hypothetical protein
MIFWSSSISALNLQYSNQFIAEWLHLSLELSNIYSKLTIKARNPMWKHPLSTKQCWKTWLKNVNYSILTEQRHNNLIIFERFIRTRYDGMWKNKRINDTKIKKLLKTYNRSIHKSAEYYHQKRKTIKTLKCSTS